MCVWVDFISMNADYNYSKEKYSLIKKNIKKYIY